MQVKEQHLVAPLLFVALFSLTFLSMVAFTSSSFTKAEVAMPDINLVAMISPKLDTALNIISENLAWSVTTSSHEAALALAQIPVSQFFGLDNYQYGQPRYTALQSHVSKDRLPEKEQGQVLGIYLVNPDFSAGQ